RADGFSGCAILPHVLVGHDVVMALDGFDAEAIELEDFVFAAESFHHAIFFSPMRPVLRTHFIAIGSPTTSAPVFSPIDGASQRCSPCAWPIRMALTCLVISSGVMLFGAHHASLSIPASRRMTLSRYASS